MRRQQFGLILPVANMTPYRYAGQNEQEMRRGTLEALNQIGIVLLQDLRSDVDSVSDYLLFIVRVVLRFV